MNPEESFYNNLLQYTGTIMIVASLAPIIIGFMKRHYFNGIIKIFWYYRIILLLFNLFIAAFIWGVNNYIDFFMPFIKMFNIQNTYFLSILIYLTNVCFGGIFFSRLLHSNLLKKITFIYFFVAIGIYIFIDGYQEYGTVNSTLFKIFIISLSLFYLTNAFKTGLNKHFFDNPFALICLGLLLPNLFQLLFSLLANDLDKTNFILYVKLKIFTNFIDFIGYFLFSWAFLKTNKTTNLLL